MHGLNKDKIKYVLRKAVSMIGASKVYAKDELESILAEAEWKDDVIIIASYLTPVRSKYLAKITLASKLYGVMPSCESVKYVPHGLYALFTADEKGIEKLVNKFRLLLSIR